MKMNLEKSDHDRVYEAYSKLGPFCPVCKNPASIFEIVPLSDGSYDGTIGCDKCEKEYSMEYDQEEKKWTILKDD